MQLRYGRVENLKRGEADARKAWHCDLFMQLLYGRVEDLKRGEAVFSERRAL